MYYYNDFLFPFHMFGFLFQIVFWVLVIYGIVWLFRRAKGERGNALDILKERYAKGEITREQFEAMKKDIK